MTLSRELGLEDFVTFTGFQSGEALLASYSTFDIGVVPDPKNTYNDKISMNKVFEYMSLGIPFVQFDLTEGRRIAGGAALYAEKNRPASLACEMARLIDDEELRAHLAREGHSRAGSLSRWESERMRLLAAFRTALRPAESVVEAAEGIPGASAPAVTQ
jgi:glycosyltransferase involved in cell wall biosynthesis